MIERIYIPTVRRTTTQITYDNLPDVLKEKVTMVVEPGERHLYNYNCNYLEIPAKLVGSWTQLAETRLFIHKHAGDIKYVVADDDIIIGYNAQFLLDVLKNQTGSTCTVKLDDSLTAAIFLSDQINNEDKITLLMPIRLNN